ERARTKARHTWPSSGWAAGVLHGTAPPVGFNVTTPQALAGKRSEPVASAPWAMETRPAATAAAEPPLEPPTVRSSAHGLGVGPNAGGSVVAPAESGGTLVLPRKVKPADRSRRPISSVEGERYAMSFSRRVPRYSGVP